MSIHSLLLFLFVQFIALYAVCQTSAKSIDKILSTSYQLLQNADYEKRYDSLAPAFKKTLTKYLSSPVTLYNALDTLETLITIRQSADKKIKFYSWDELTGGTWHEINSFAQFEGNGNKVIYKQLDTDKEMENGGYSDSEIYKVYEIREGQKVYYLTFGWGTHGNGNQHQIVYLLKIDGDKLIKCKAFNNGELSLSFEYSRSDKMNLDFDNLTKTLSFDEFAESDGEPFAQKTGKRKTLKFSNGVFR